MKLRFGLIGLTLTSLGGLASSNAADVYRGPAGGYKDVPYVAMDWAGFYAGVNGGGAWAGNNQLVDLVSNSNPFFGVSPSGGFGGGQIGYNWQGIWYPRLVLGVEADIQGAGISDRGSVFDAPSGLTFHFKSDLDFFGTVRGRLGYATDNALLYFTGGFAYGGLHKSTDDFGPPTQRFDGTATGYVLGGGVEYKFSPVWSAKVEYQYLNFGKNDACGFGNGCFSDFANAGPQKDDDFHTVRLGLNYYFVPVYGPLK
jgi:outer membrane immunogenic protein